MKAREDKSNDDGESAGNSTDAKKKGSLIVKLPVARKPNGEDQPDRLLVKLPISLDTDDKAAESKY